MRSDRGSATIEYIGVVLALMVPIAYAVVAFTQVQSAQFGVVGAAQQAGRAYVNARSELYAQYAAVRAAAIAGRNHGVFIDATNVRIACEQPPCLQPGTEVRVEVSTRQPIPYAPWLGRIPLHATHRVVVDEFRASAE